MAIHEKYQEGRMRLRRARFTPVSKDRGPHAPFGRQSEGDFALSTLYVKSVYRWLAGAAGCAVTSTMSPRRRASARAISGKGTLTAMITAMMYSAVL